LWQAVRYGHLDVAHLLLEHGVDVSRTNGCGWTSLHCAAFKGDNNVVQFLLDHGADVNGGDEKYGQPAAAGVRKWGH
jgi:ankyrin repeat protein